MRCRLLLAYTIFTTLALFATPTFAQHSVARQWNEALLETIGNDYADPSIQARNLFHTSIALYDAWAAYGDGPEQTYLLGQTVGGFTVPLTGARPDDVEEASRQATSYAAYRLIKYRFANAAGLESRLTRTHVNPNSRLMTRIEPKRSFPHTTTLPIGE